VHVKITVEVCAGGEMVKTEVAYLERETLNNATCGLSMLEAKTLLANVQQALVNAQAAAHVSAYNRCQECGQALARKDSTTIVVRTLFGKVRLASPRYRRCVCQKRLPANEVTVLWLGPYRNARRRSSATCNANGPPCCRMV
jgi:hypothetical protein